MSVYILYRQEKRKKEKSENIQMFFCENWRKFLKKPVFSEYTKEMNTKKQDEDEREKQKFKNKICMEFVIIAEKTDVFFLFYPQL